MKSNAFKKFKKEMGQANHFLITILIGLDAVSDGARKKESFKTTWDPKDVDNSVERSRLFAIKSSLAWTVDNVDMYFKLIRRKPTLIGLNDKCFNDAGYSVYAKFNCFNSKYSQISDNKKAFVDLIINWRNNTIHYDVSNNIQINSKYYFENSVVFDKDLAKYNLDAKGMLDRFYDGKIPTFKECATLISMTIQYISQLDEIIMSEINQIEFINNLLFESFNTNEITNIFITKKSLVKKEDSEIYQKRYSKIVQYLITQGIKIDELDEKSIDYIKEIATYSIEHLRTQLT